MTAYYNEFDPFAAAWLRELIAKELIPEGDVDERDIRNVHPDDLRGYKQCHFFAGIGGWAYALRLAGWPDDRPVWTGSPPCQPFSVAGLGLGVKDERHLAPVFLDLVRECRPPVLLGEQVAAAVTKDGWLDSLFDALEDAGYACGAAVMPACSVGAPHIRQRLWFVAKRMANAPLCGRAELAQQYGSGGKAYCARAGNGGGDGVAGQPCTPDSPWADTEALLCVSGEGCGAGGVADGSREGLPERICNRHVQRETLGAHQRQASECCGDAGRLADMHGQRFDWQHVLLQPRGQEQAGAEVACGSGDGRMADTDGRKRDGRAATARGHDSNRTDSGRAEGDGGAASDSAPCRPGQIDGFWDDADWLFCRDGKWRPVESGSFPLADGVSARVGRLRGYGNAIVPQVAAEIIRAVM